MGGSQDDIGPDILSEEGANLCSGMVRPKWYDRSQGA